MRGEGRRCEKWGGDVKKGKGRGEGRGWKRGGEGNGEGRKGDPMKVFQWARLGSHAKPVPDVTDKKMSYYVQQKLDQFPSLQPKK